jgi:glycolate oxidase iron-sulfur subunit
MTGGISRPPPSGSPSTSPTPPAVQAEIDRCNKCGFCMAGCPTYKELPLEWLVTRGRVSLLQDVLAGRLDPDDPGFLEAIDSCLKCRACVAHCPPEVQIDRLILFARAARREQHGLSRLEWLLYRVVPARPWLFRGLVLAGHAAEKTGFRRLARHSGMLRWLPGLQRAIEVGPTLPRVSGRQLIERQGSRDGPLENPRDRVVYFLGCAKDFLYPRAALATYRVLRRNRVHIEMPRVVCCGLPAHSAGDLEGARRLARSNLRALCSTGVRAIVVDESSCASHLRHLGELFAGQPEEEAMQRLAERVVDLSVYLDRLGIDIPGPLPGRVAWHDPCHLRHYEGIVEAPRNLIRLVPGAELVESALEPGCCGGAGAVILTQPEIADAILERRLAGFRAAGAEAIITSGPSCVTQYRRAPDGLPVLYLSEYLERAYAAE